MCLYVLAHIIYRVRTNFEVVFELLFSSSSSSISSFIKAIKIWTSLNRRNFWKSLKIIDNKKNVNDKFFFWFEYLFHVIQVNPFQSNFLRLLSHSYFSLDWRRSISFSYKILLLCSIKRLTATSPNERWRVRNDCHALTMCLQ